MKIGLKIYGREDFEKIFPLLEDIDFIEVMAIETEDYSFLANIKIPFVVHCEHQKWGVNFANAMNFTKNRKALNFAVSLADRLKAKFIVVHPGHKEKGFCAEKNAGHFLSNYTDKRIIIENLPENVEGYDETYGASFGSMSKLMEESGKGFCLDFEHASLTAKDRGEDIIEFIKEMMKLNPCYFHLCNAKLGRNAENHLSLSKGNLPISEIKKLIPADSWVLLETWHNLEEHKKDINFLRD